MVGVTKMKETLRELRLQAKKTCAEVAQALGVANSSYYSYEQGVRQNARQGKSTTK